MLVFLVAIAGLYALVQSNEFKSLWEFVWRSLAVQLKIVWSAAQILAQYPTLLHRGLPPALANVLGYLKLVAVDPVQIPYLPCWDHRLDRFFTKLAIVTIFPIILVLFGVAWYLIRTRILKYDIQESRRRFVGLFFLLCYFVLPTVSTAIFSTFQCDKEFGDKDEYQFLVADYRYNCIGKAYQRRLPFSILAMFIYPIGIHLLYIIILYQNRDTIKNEGGGIEHIKFLYISYSPEAWYYEPIDSIRRLCCTGLLVFFPKTRITTAALIALLFHVIQQSIKPYKRAEDNTLAEVSTLALQFTLLMLMAAQVTETNVGIFSASSVTLICSVSNLVVFPAIVAYFVLYIRQRSAVLRSLKRFESAFENIQDGIQQIESALENIQDGIQKPLEEGRGIFVRCVGFLYKPKKTPPRQISIHQKSPNRRDAVFIHVAAEKERAFDLTHFKSIWDSGQNSRRQLMNLVIERADRWALNYPIHYDKWKDFLDMVEALAALDQKTLGSACDLDLGVKFIREGRWCFARVVDLKRGKGAEGRGTLRIINFERADEEVVVNEHNYTIAFPDSHSSDPLSYEVRHAYYSVVIETQCLYDLILTIWHSHRLSLHCKRSHGPRSAISSIA